VILYATLGWCTLGAAIVVYRHDLYDREPIPLLALTVLLGMGAMSLAGHVEAWTLSSSRLTTPGAIATVAALEEELLKLLVVVAIAVGARRQFNDPIDGLIYGSMGAVLMVGGLLVYGVLTAVGSRWSHDLFAPRTPARLWGWPFA
jgi:RsiW-degrading membrane proteinase PrsW (M82 family)